MRLRWKALPLVVAAPLGWLAVRGDSKYPDAEKLKALEGAKYIQLSAREKLDLLWAETMRTRYPVLPRITFSWLAMAWRLINLWWLRKPFDLRSDIRPPRRKIFHAFGSIAKARLVPAPGHPFTGLWESGAIGLVRPSIAHDAGLGFSTGTSLKFLVDGRPSANSLVNPSMDPQGFNHDFFAFESTNLLAAPKLPPFGPFWFAAMRWMGQIAPPLDQPVDDFAAVTSNGEVVEEPVSPEQIFLCPPEEIHMRPDTAEDFRAEFENIPPGSVLFEVYGKHRRDDEERIHLGRIETDSWFVASAFPDRVLSFHHKKEKPAAAG